jgi:hypothetical protein
LPREVPDGVRVAQLRPWEDLFEPPVAEGWLGGDGPRDGDAGDERAKSRASLRYPGSMSGGLSGAAGSSVSPPRLVGS